MKRAYQVSREVYSYECDGCGKKGPSRNCHHEPVPSFLTELKYTHEVFDHGRGRHYEVEFHLCARCVEKVRDLAQEGKLK